MALPGFLRSFYCGELFCRIICYLCNFHFQYCIMDDRQHFIDYTSFIPAIGVFVLIRMANDQLVTMVASHVLCGVLFVSWSAGYCGWTILMWFCFGWAGFCSGYGIGSGWSQAGL